MVRSFFQQIVAEGKMEHLDVSFKIFCITVLTAATSSILAANPAFQAGFPVILEGDWPRSASVALGDINGDGVADVVIGGLDGKVHAYTGSGVKLWTYDTGDTAIGGKAAIGDVDGDGFSEVVIGAGSNVTRNAHGGLYVLNHLGRLQCRFATGDFNQDGWQDGVYSSPAIADLDENDNGRLEIAFGAWDAYVRVLNHDCSVLWEKYVRDSVWSSPAIGDLDADGSKEVVIGVDSHLEPAFGTADGGILHVYRADGSSELPGFPVQIDEAIWSSPALGDIDGDGWLDIVVGTGYCWSNPDCAVPPPWGGGVHPGVGQYINAWDRHGNYLPGWPVSTPGTTSSSSPALADLDGNGDLEVVLNTQHATDPEGGQVHVLNGDGTSRLGWPKRPVTPATPTQNISRQTAGSPVVADINQDGLPEIMLPSNWELVVWDRDGNQLTRNDFPDPPGSLVMSTNFTVAGTASVGDLDGDGDLEVCAGSASDSTGADGAIYAWDFPAAATTSTLNWPVFRASEHNIGRRNLDEIFSGNFERGDTSRWSSTVP